MSVFKSEMRGKTIELNKSDAAVGVHELCGTKQEISQNEEDVCLKRERNAKRIKKAAVFAVSVFVLAVTIISVTNFAKRRIQQNHFEEKITASSVGDCIQFGMYEQDNDLSNGKEPIDWLVLDKTDSRVLMISKYGLDCKQYNSTYIYAAWEECSLMTWMNKIFPKETFSSAERSVIQGSGNISAEIFLLSTNEVNKYFSSDDEKMCEPTKYAAANGAYVNGRSGNCWWWLRSPGADQNCVACVRDDGSIYYNGRLAGSTYGCVRPAVLFSRK